MDWYMKVIKNYVGFSGRARRKEYWMFTLVNFIISLFLMFLEYYTELMMFSILSGLYSLFIFLPSLSVTFRRLHDTGRTGAWILIALIPIIGAIVLLIFTCLDSEEDMNEYGENPKYSY